MLGNLIKGFPEWCEHTNGIAQYISKLFPTSRHLIPFSPPLITIHQLTNIPSQPGPPSPPKVSAAACSTTTRASRNESLPSGVYPPTGTRGRSSSSVRLMGHLVEGRTSSLPTSSPGLRCLALECRWGVGRGGLIDRIGQEGCCKFKLFDYSFREQTS